jgi:acetamidase/formamidase
MIGDLHAAQGQGEIIGGAIETSGKVDCTIGLIKGRTIRGPRLKDATQLMAMGTAGDLRGAIVEAYAHLLDWLVEGFGMNRWDAYNLMSQTGSISLSNFGFPPFTVAAGIPIDALPEHRRTEK